MNSTITHDIEQIVDRLDLSPLKGKSVLLTGSNGFLGRYIAMVVSMLNQKYDYGTTLYCWSLHAPNDDIKNLAKNDPNIIPQSVNLSKPITFTKEVDFILHAAGYAQPKKFIENIFETIELNIHATHSLLEIAKKNNARFLFFSSAEVYGDIPKNLISVSEKYNGCIDTSNIRSMYAESKRLGETICSMYRQNEDVNAFVARISHVYGPGISTTDKRVIGECIRKAFEEKVITLEDQGTAIKTWGYIADIIQMILNILTHGTELIYNVGGIDTMSIKELAEEIGRQTNADVVTPQSNGKKDNSIHDPQFVKLNITKYSKEFGDPTFISFSEGIRRTIEWNRNISQLV